MSSEGILVKKAFDFSLKIIKLHLKLKEEREYEISRQLLRSATSIGANIEEAGAAISKRDFIHKMSIAKKEAREARYWLRILFASKLVSYDLKDLLSISEELVKITTSSVKTAQKNLKDEKNNQ